MSSEFNFDLEDEMRVHLESFAFANLPECDILKSNAKILIDHFIIIQNEGLDHKGLKDRLFRDLDFYNGQLSHLLSLAKANHNDFEVRRKVQNLTAYYICSLTAKSYGISLKGLKIKLAKIETTSRKLRELLKFDILEFDEELALIGGSLIFSDLIKTAEKNSSASEHKKMMDDILINRGKRLFRELDFFSNIRDEFAVSILGKWLQFGESGPKESSAINVWLTGLVEVWVFNLKRSLTYTDDPDAGREQFLCFAESCFEYVHPTLAADSPDSLRNAYEKLRKKGKFDYLKQNSSMLV